MALNKIRKIMKENGLDGMLLRKRNHFSWVTGGRQNQIVLSITEGVADLLIFEKEIYVVTTKMEERRIREEELAHFPHEVKVVADEWYEGSDHLIAELGKGKTMGTDTPFEDYADMTEALKSVRSILDESEAGRYRKLCQDAAGSLESVCRTMEPGQTEHEIAGMVAKQAISKGIRLQVMLVATDERIFSYRHPIPTSKKLNKHALLVICGEREGLVANLTRVVHFGPLPQELADHKEKLSRIDAAFITSTVPGATVGEVFKKGILQYVKEGHPEDWKLLHQGGPTGFDSREFIATMDSKTEVKEHMAFTWNPSLPGVKSEDTVLIHQEGAEILTETGEWPYIEVTFGGQTLRRPDILIR
ncbi:aminopeptidase P family N-terminal domain-containing protein [Fictibacillus sp. KIGAM418]|uniref:Aminopeptidase P family N-terminal domain-containing protein n=1 Tax=Fictibacillus marinisediminis TaxID=2878389 RepID=A0A9X1XFX7_9BACL|nr:M24 family metallopeptidase [Fictibacillus marinisediminis]MCK6259160.1 aminopeptidase P family N-terminal domain-containing protein [Fictibacillus marinisediminis]